MTDARSIVERTAALLRAACVLACGLLLAFGAMAQAPPPINGHWATTGFGSIVDLYPCADEPATLCGKIVWLWEAADKNGRPRTDSHNPARAQRSRALIGIELISGLRETAPGVWTDGALYNPDDGRTYTGTMRTKGAVLELRGCALGVFCQTQTWRRPEDVLATVDRLAQ